MRVGGPPAERRACGDAGGGRARRVRTTRAAAGAGPPTGRGLRGDRAHRGRPHARAGGGSRARRRADGRRVLRAPAAVQVPGPERAVAHVARRGRRARGARAGAGVAPAYISAARRAAEDARPPNPQSDSCARGAHRGDERGERLRAELLPQRRRPLPAVRVPPVRGRLLPQALRGRRDGGRAVRAVHRHEARGRDLDHVRHAVPLRQLPLALQRRLVPGRRLVHQVRDGRVPRQQGPRGVRRVRGRRRAVRVPARLVPRPHVGPLHAVLDRAVPGRPGARALHRLGDRRRGLRVGARGERALGGAGAPQVFKADARVGRPALHPAARGPECLK